MCLACPAGLIGSTVGASDCAFCPYDKYAPTAGMSQCSPCPVSGACLLGVPAMLPADVLQRPIKQKQIGVNPFPVEFDAAKQTLSSLKVSVYIVLGVVFALFMAWAVRFKSSGGTGDCSIKGKTVQLKMLDLFFAAKHATPENTSSKAFSTPLGGIFSLMTIFLVVGLAYLLSVQNTALPEQTSSITTTGIPFEPVGTYKLEVIVYGNGFDFASTCRSNITLLPKLMSDWTGTMPTVPNVFDPSASTCTLTWLCTNCKISSSFSSPRFTLSSNLVSWAAGFQYTLYTPALLAEGGTDNGPAFSVNNVLFPVATNALSTYQAFRYNQGCTGSCAVQGSVAPVISLQLTGFVVNDTTKNPAVVRATYQPSVATIDTASALTIESYTQYGAGAGACSPSFIGGCGAAGSAGVVLSSSLPGLGLYRPLPGGFPTNRGFQLELVLSRNSVSLITTLVNADAFNLVVLIASLAGSVISGIAALFTQVEKYFDDKSAELEADGDMDKEKQSAKGVRHINLVLLEVENT
jgi:hypothetical protein